jgi:hypothetical protein
MKQNEGGIVAKNARSRDTIDRPELLGEFGVLRQLRMRLTMGGDGETSDRALIRCVAERQPC